MIFLQIKEIKLVRKTRVRINRFGLYVYVLVRIESNTYPARFKNTLATRNMFLYPDVGYNNNRIELFMFNSIVQIRMRFTTVSISNISYDRHSTRSEEL